MPTVKSKVKCKQCGFPNAIKDFDSGTNEYCISCTRCGCRETFKNKSYFSSGRPEKTVYEINYSAGAYFVKWKDGGGAHGRLSEAEVKGIPARMRADVAAGKLSKETYVTRFDFKTREVTALVGQLPTHDPAEQECELEEEICEAVDEQEVDDLSSEI